MKTEQQILDEFVEWCEDINKDFEENFFSVSQKED